MRNGPTTRTTRSTTLTERRETMIDKQTFKKELVRMWDSSRNEGFKGSKFCEGADCDHCVLKSSCGVWCDFAAPYNAFEIIDVIEKWSREHPRKYKISPFEYEYLKLYQKHSFGSHRLCDLTGTIILHELSYLKGIDLNVKVEDILLNCEVVEDDG